MDFFNGQLNYQYPQTNGYYSWNQPRPQNSIYMPDTPTFDGVFTISGESAAREFPIARGTRALLMDTKDDVFYVKVVDSNGNVISFRTFDYVEREGATTSSKDKTEVKDTAPTGQFVTKEELDNHFNRLMDFIEEKVKPKEIKEVKKK